MDGRLAREAAVLAACACGITVGAIWLTNVPPALVVLLAACAGAAMLLTRHCRPSSGVPAPAPLRSLGADAACGSGCSERSSRVPPIKRPD